MVPLAPGANGSAALVGPLGADGRAGERIAVGTNGGVDVFAPLSGRLAGTGRARVALGDDVAGVPAAEVTDLADPPGLEPAEAQWDWQAAGGGSCRLASRPAAC